jgi:hypothetical protein
MALIETTATTSSHDFEAPAAATTRGAVRPRVLILKQMMGWLGVAMAFSLGMNLLWWGLLSPDAHPDTVDQFDIPYGTAAAIASGTGFAFVPSRFALPPGGRLRIVNHDVVEHTIGTATIPPDAWAEISAPESGGFTCTVHPSGYIGIDLRERPSIFTMLLPTLLLGLPLGLLGGAAIVITKRI